MGTSWGQHASAYSAAAAAVGRRRRLVQPAVGRVEAADSHVWGRETGRVDARERRRSAAAVPSGGELAVSSCAGAGIAHGCRDRRLAFRARHFVVAWSRRAVGRALSQGDTDAHQVSGANVNRPAWSSPMLVARRAAATPPLFVGFAFVIADRYWPEATSAATPLSLGARRREAGVRKVGHSVLEAGVRRLVRDALIAERGARETACRRRCVGKHWRSRTRGWRISGRRDATGRALLFA